MKYLNATCRGCYALGTACGQCEKCADERARMSFNDVAIAAKARPELHALTEVLMIAVPGLKGPHATLAAQMERMLLKRGVKLALATPARPDREVTP